MSSKGLAYFKEVYDQVPGWVQQMHDYSPDMLDHYTNLRGNIMKPGALSVKEKDILLVGMNAARLYERSMVYHTKGAIDGGATLAELAEYILVSYIYNGNQAILTGLKSMRYACKLVGKELPNVKASETVEEILNECIEMVGDKDSAFIKTVLQTKRENKDMEEVILRDGHVSRKNKLLLMSGIYITVLDGKTAGIWMEKARVNGAVEPELAEVGAICLLTAGIPAWFEASDSLRMGQGK